MSFETAGKVKMTKSEAGRLGALARIAKHGNPGTVEGRKKGGFQSLKTHKKLKTGFVLEQDFRKPKNSKDLAEFIGIMLGDGHLTKYQASMNTGSETDMQHAKHVKKLAHKLFGIKPTIRYKKDCKAVEVAISSIGLVTWLKSKGMPIGNKMSTICVPDWVKENRSFSQKFLRGLFDTDGCTFIDTHIIRGKKYKNRGWTITSYSAKLRNDIVELLQSLGFSPTLRDSQLSVYMRKRIDVERYFREIGTSNAKHLRRYLRNLTK
jgi:intein/homing endonuclease